MRDTNRIHPICEKLEQYWSQWPDLRFGQFVYNFFKWIDYNKRLDPFYIEDDMMVELLKEYMKDKE